MVCCTLPPNLPNPILVYNVLNHLAGHHQFNRDPSRPDLKAKDIMSWVEDRGFTLYMYGLYYNGGVGRPEVYFVRTIEEGWVALDCETARWKRLGWLDWGRYESSDFRCDLAKAVMVFDEEEGAEEWRYERPQRLDGKRLKHFKYVLRY